MTFPTPQVAGVFLKLPRRVEDAIRRGTVLSSNDGASRYLMNGDPRRLRNSVGFHAAIAEFVDALLERAVLPYQVTRTLSSLSVLPDAGIGAGAQGSPVLECPATLDSTLADADRRAQLGAERRFAPAEFWRSMILGSDAVARDTSLFGYPRDASGDFDVEVYPPSLYPATGQVGGFPGPGDMRAAGFYDVDDTGWVKDANDFPGHWLPENHPWGAPAPSEQGVVNPLEDVDDLGRATLEVFSMLTYPQDWSGCTSYSMLLRLGGFAGVPWPWGGYVDHQYLAPGVPLHSGFNFVAVHAFNQAWGHGIYTCPDMPPPIFSTPYFCDYVGDWAFPGLRAPAMAAYGVRTRLRIACERGYEDPESLAGPWISPVFYRQLVPTWRPNLDILRIQQVLLGSMAMTWAKVVATFKVPHEKTRCVYTYTVDNRTGEVVGAPLVVRTDMHLYRDNQAHWEHGTETVDARPEGGQVCGGAAVQLEVDLTELDDGSDGSGGSDGCTSYLLDMFSRDTSIEECIDVTDILLRIWTAGRATYVDGTFATQCPDDPLVTALVWYFYANPDAPPESFIPPYDPITFSLATWREHPTETSSYPFHAVYRCRTTVADQSAASTSVDASFWPAAALVNGGYVDKETVALGLLTTDSSDVYGYYLASPGDTAYSTARDYVDVADYRRIAMNSTLDVDVQSPTTLARGLLLSPIGADPPGLGLHDRHESPGGLGDVFAVTHELGLLPPLFSTVPMDGPHVTRQMRVKACYHPDIAPSWASPLDCGGLRRPYKFIVTVYDVDGTYGENEIRLDRGDTALRFSVYFSACYTPAYVDSISEVREEVNVQAEPEMAIRSQWNWKSMPVNSEG